MIRNVGHTRLGLLIYSYYKLSNRFIHITNYQTEIQQVTGFSSQDLDFGFGLGPSWTIEVDLTKMQIESLKFKLNYYTICIKCIRFKILGNLLILKSGLDATFILVCSGRLSNYKYVDWAVL